MNTINNLRRTLKPLMPLCASAMLVTSACSSPKEGNVNESVKVETVSPTDEEAFWEYMQSEAWAARFLLGVGIGLAGIAATKKVREANKISKEKEQAQYRKEILAELDSYYFDCGYLGRGLQIKYIKNMLEKPLGYDKVVKANVKFLVDKYDATSPRDSSRRLAALPDLKYFIDKMTSSPEEWEVNRNKYPDWEKNINTSDFSAHANRCSNYVLGIYNSAEHNLSKALVHTLNELKKEIFEYGVFDNSAFADLIVSIDGSLAKLRLGAEASDLITEIREGIVPNVGLILGSIGMPVESSKASSFESGDKYDNEDEFESDEEPVRRENAFTNAIKRARESSVSSDSDYDNNLSFKDIGGQDNVIEQLSKKVLYPILYPKGFPNRKTGTGIVLHGPSGTGKTMLAMALANEAQVPFYKVDCTELLDQYVGSSEKNLRKLFKNALEHQPCIMFFDEIDSIARKRTGDSTGRHDDKLVNQFLTLLNELANNKDLFIIAATNRLDILDNAILRGRRLGTHIEVSPPNTPEAVEQILDLYLKAIPVSPDFSKAKFVQKILSMKATGATIADVVDEAYEQAYERLGIYNKMAKRMFKQKDLDKLKVIDVDFEKALIRLNNGTLQPRKPIGFNK